MIRKVKLEDSGDTVQFTKYMTNGVNSKDYMKKQANARISKNTKDEMNKFIEGNRKPGVAAENKKIGRGLGWLC